MGRLFLVDMDDPVKLYWERCACPRCHTAIAFLTNLARWKATVHPEDGDDSIEFDFNVEITPTEEENKSRVRGTFTKV
ncbi:hypothetical protein CRG98_019555 [Punica granatum]|uniref:Uncharacterized protein n=1 Tax=Punica granatum TaxID=22663 RepID=A0A2I0JW19_PUNGR|nr:hypothetical protein CRG98_019555 [Punica granatum]